MCRQSTLGSGSSGCNEGDDDEWILRTLTYLLVEINVTSLFINFVCFSLPFSLVFRTVRALVFVCAPVFVWRRTFFVCSSHRIAPYYRQYFCRPKSAFWSISTTISNPSASYYLTISSLSLDSRECFNSFASCVPWPYFRNFRPILTILMQNESTDFIWVFFCENARKAAVNRERQFFFFFVFLC